MHSDYFKCLWPLFEPISRVHPCLFHVIPTFLCRYRKVAYLDTDVGQPEFTPPGFISLTIIDEVSPGIELISTSLSVM